MSATLVRDLMSKAKPGYRAVPVKGGLYAILGPDGKEVRSASNQPIRVAGESGSSHYRRRAVANLQNAGVIPVHRRQAQERHEPLKVKGRVAEKGRVQEHTNPILLAKEFLQDVKSSPRERAMAREYLSLLDTHQTVRALAAQLGGRLGERHRAA